MTRPLRVYDPGMMHAPVFRWFNGISSTLLGVLSRRRLSLLSQRHYNWWTFYLITRSTRICAVFPRLLPAPRIFTLLYTHVQVVSKVDGLTWIPSRCDERKIFVPSLCEKELSQNCVIISVISRFPGLMNLNVISGFRNDGTNLEKLLNSRKNVYLYILKLIREIGKRWKKERKRNWHLRDCKLIESKPFIK